MFSAYILKSDLTPKHYYGSTGDVYKKLEDHNFGRVKFTKPFRPWKLHYLEEFHTRSEALSREKFFKSIDGYNWLKRQGLI